MKTGALFWGVWIYALLFLMWSLFEAYGWIYGLVPRIVFFGALVILAFVAGHSLRLRSWSDILPYSLAWTLSALCLDALFAYPVGHWGMYSNPDLWISYVILFCVPLFSTLTRHEISPTRGFWES